MAKKTLILRIKSFGYALKGIWELFSTQFNARLHLFIAAAAVCLGFLFKISAVEWLAIALSSGLVLSAEAMNTAIEYLCDFVSPEYHSKIGKIKDLAAGAVMLAAVGAFVVGLIIFLPRIFACIC